MEVTGFRWKRRKGRARLACEEREGVKREGKKRERKGGNRELEREVVEPAEGR